MKPGMIALCVLCILFELAAYVELKQFLSTHREETAEHIYKGLTVRCLLMLAVPGAAVLLMMALHALG